MLLAFFIIFFHWLSDFCLQTHWQSMNKSKNWNALARHVSSYSLSMSFLIFLLNIFTDHVFALSSVFLFGIITFVTHFMTDAVTSRITSRLHAREEYHNFFVVIGFDQVIHYSTLFATLSWLNYHL